MLQLNIHQLEVMKNVENQQKDTRINRAPPNANDVFRETEENKPIDIDVLENDIDMEGDTDRLTIVELRQQKDNTEYIANDGV